MNIGRPISSAVLITVVSLLGCARAEADGSITGWVRDELNDPIVWVWVDAYAPSGEWASSGFSEFDGQYEIAGLSNGEYFVRTFVLECDFLDEWYDDVPVVGWEIPAAATPILVADGITSNINFVLSSGGAITGRVTELTGASLSNVWVDAYDLSGGLVKSAITETEGTYRLGGLPPAGITYEPRLWV
ncbi:MAG: carboxypeptidase regulatory-like domain-containing protein [Kiritimatiellia bacterium]